MRPDAPALGVGFLLVQIVVGYEWLSSGMTKLVHGDFPGGLADDLHERSKDSYVSVPGIFSSRWSMPVHRRGGA